MKVHLEGLDEHLKNEQELSEQELSELLLFMADEKDDRVLFMLKIVLSLRMSIENKYTSLLCEMCKVAIDSKMYSINKERLDDIKESIGMCYEERYKNSPNNILPYAVMIIGAAIIFSCLLNPASLIVAASAIAVIGAYIIGAALILSCPTYMYYKISEKNKTLRFFSDAKTHVSSYESYSSGGPSSRNIEFSDKPYCDKHLSAPQT